MAFVLYLWLSGMSAASVDIQRRVPGGAWDTRGTSGAEAGVTPRVTVGDLLETASLV